MFQTTTQMFQTITYFPEGRIFWEVTSPLGNFQGLPFNTRKLASVFKEAPLSLVRRRCREVKEDVKSYSFGNPIGTAYPGLCLRNRGTFDYANFPPEFL